MSYASASDISAVLGRDPADVAETTQWEAWLDIVERAIVRGFRRSGLVLDDEITAGTVLVDDVVDIEVLRVVAKIQNPTWGRTSVTRALDDASITERNDNGAAGDPLLLTEADWSALLPDGPVQGAFSTRPGFEMDSTLCTGGWSSPSSYVP